MSVLQGDAVSIHEHDRQEVPLSSQEISKSEASSVSAASSTGLTEQDGRAGTASQGEQPSLGGGSSSSNADESKAPSVVVQNDDEAEDASESKPEAQQPKTRSRAGRGSLKPSRTQDAGQVEEEPSSPPVQDSVILERYALYKTESRIYIVASNQSDSRYRVLKIDRHFSHTDASHELNIVEDSMIYSKEEVSDLLKMIEIGNRTTGGLQRTVPLFYGIVGFIRFTAGWYAVLIKARAPVALLGGHYVYHCEESMTIPISNNAKPEKQAEETRLYNAFQQVDLSKNFYFSYSYDLTNTLQTNLTRPSASRATSAFSPSHPVFQPHWIADHAFHESSDPASAQTSLPQPSQAKPALKRGQVPVTSQTPVASAWGFNDRFVWNHFLLRAAFQSHMNDKKDSSYWILPIIHGYVDQAKLSVFGRTVYVTLIARRSRHFAGARFLKRGVNDEGNVANDVETEQIVAEALTTSFYVPDPARKGFSKPTSRYTSYVQNRGSIPLSWQQDTTTSSLKPPIHLHLIDPYHSAAALHFDDLFARYGTPVIVLNLIKTREHEPRESRLSKPFQECIDYLNQFLPALPEDGPDLHDAGHAKGAASAKAKKRAKMIEYVPLDMSAANKNRNTDVVSVLEDIAQDVVHKTGFFHSGGESPGLDTGREHPAVGRGSERERSGLRTTPLLQNGVCRTNCIDCLDRTNAAQFVVAKSAFAHQLYALGIISVPDLPYDNDAVNLLTEMYHDHGDTIALQYGGSHLVNTMDTYRKINQWTSHSRDMIEGIKRFYANVALDQDKQNAINLFLGIDGVANTNTGQEVLNRPERRSSSGSTLSLPMGALSVSGSPTPSSLSVSKVSPTASTGSLGPSALSTTPNSLLGAVTESMGISPFPDSSPRDRLVENASYEKGISEHVERDQGGIHRLTDGDIIGDSDSVDDLYWNEGGFKKRDYRHWFTPEFVEKKLSKEELDRRMKESAQEDGNYWLEYYRPKLFTQLDRHFAYKVNSTARYNPAMQRPDKIVYDPSDLSPFKGRPTGGSYQGPRISSGGLRRWMSVPKKPTREELLSRSAKDREGAEKEKELASDEEKDLPPVNTTEGLAVRLLKPKVQPAEANEYASYVDQYRNLNLSNELLYESSARDLEMYETAVMISSNRGGASGLERERVSNNTASARAGHGSPDPAILGIDRASLEAYEKHVRVLKEHSRVMGGNATGPGAAAWAEESETSA